MFHKLKSNNSSRKMLAVWREVFQPEAGRDAEKDEERGEDDETSTGGACLVWSLIFSLTSQQYPLVKAGQIERESGEL